MTSLKPYLIRSIYEWIVDNQLTPHLLVDAENTDAILPQDFIEEGKIVLNIRPEAIQGLTLGNEEIQFNARFSGNPMHIVTPTTAVLAIYAKENGKGMIFDPEEYNDAPPPPEKKHTKPKLRVIK
ncbi:MAG: ClpXP protease specificity-enhancing factor [Methylococcales bacterium]|nr:ClpXP protease specificity-enhancing factor [Methylococcales bacterium]